MLANLQYREKIYSTPGGAHINVNAEGLVGFRGIGHTPPDDNSPTWRFGAHQHWVKEGGHLHTDGLSLYLDYSLPLENI